MNARCGGGFSLIELLTVVAVMAILLAVAVPGYRSVVISNRLSTAANDIVAGFNAARIEAIRRNNTTQLCGSTGNGSGTLGTYCSAAGAGTVYVTEPNDANGNAVDPIPSYTPPALPTGIQLGSGSNSMVALRFGGQGLAHTTASSAPYTGLLADVYSSQTSSDSHRCLYVQTGSVINSCSYNTTCPAINAAPTSCQ